MLTLRPLVDAGWRWFYRFAFIGFACYTRLRRPKLRSAHVLVWWNERLLVVRHSYKRGISAPAGMLKRGEDAAIGAARELREEVGIDVPPAELRLLSESQIEVEGARDTVHLFELRCDAEPTINIDNREIIWGGFLELTEIRAQRMRPVFAKLIDNRVAPGPPA